METLISQHEKIAIQLNKEVLLSEQSRMQLKNQLEKAKRSNMVMKSKLETIEENYRMQRYQQIIDLATVYKNCYGHFLATYTFIRLLKVIYRM